MLAPRWSGAESDHSCLLYGFRCRLWSRLPKRRWLWSGSAVQEETSGFWHAVRQLECTLQLTTSKSFAMAVSKHQLQGGQFCVLGLLRSFSRKSATEPGSRNIQVLFVVRAGTYGLGLSCSRLRHSRNPSAVVLWELRERRPSFPLGSVSGDRRQETGARPDNCNNSSAAAVDDRSASARFVADQASIPPNVSTAITYSTLACTRLVRNEDLPKPTTQQQALFDLAPEGNCLQHFQRCAVTSAISFRSSGRMVGSSGSCKLYHRAKTLHARDSWPRHAASLPRGLEPGPNELRQASCAYQRALWEHFQHLRIDGG